MKPTSPTSAPLDLLALGLPDGRTWTLGARGLGRPFLATLRLSNTGDGPVRLWDPESSEGSRCAAVELVDGAGLVTTLRSPPSERSGTPTVVTIPPHGVYKVDLELLRLIGTKSLAPGKYTARGTYENKLEHVLGIRNVWTGRLTTAPVEIQVVSPE